MSGQDESATTSRTQEGSVASIDLAELRKDAVYVRTLMDFDPSQAGGFLDQFSAATLALVAAVEAAEELSGAICDVRLWEGRSYAKLWTAADRLDDALAPFSAPRSGAVRAGHTTEGDTDGH